jgi:hypothetical protein
MSTKKKAPAKKVKKASSAKKAKAKTQINDFAKSISKATEKAVKAKKTKAAPAEKPALEEILQEAEKAFTGVVRRYLDLGLAYVKAITFYGAEGKKAFLTRFPLTDNALRNLELVGKGRLMPQFAMCSNRFTVGLANMANSMLWQQKLLGISKNGTVRVKVGDNVVDKPWTDFVKNSDIDGVLSILAEADKDLTQEQLADKLLKLKKKVRANFSHYKKSPYVVTADTTGAYARFYSSKPFTAAQLRRIADEIDAEEAAFKK